MLADDRNQFGDEADVVGFSVGIGMHPQHQPAFHRLGDQSPAPEYPTPQSPQRLEPFGHMLDGLSVQGDHRPGVEATRQGLLSRLGEDRPQALGASGQKRHAQVQWEAAEFLVSRRSMRGEFALRCGLPEPLVGAVGSPDQNIMDQTDQSREADLLGVTASPMFLEEIFQEGLVGHPLPSGQDRFGQGEAGENLTGQVVHDQLLGQFGASTHNEDGTEQGVMYAQDPESSG